MGTENRKFNVAVAGATGAVGGAMLDVLARKNFPLKRAAAPGLRRVPSARSFPSGVKRSRSRR